MGNVLILHATRGHGSRLKIIARKMHQLFNYEYKYLNFIKMVKKGPKLLKCFFSSTEETPYKKKEKKVDS